MYRKFFIHCSFLGQLVCLQVYALEKRAALNIAVHVSFDTDFPRIYGPEWNGWILCSSRF